MANVFYRLYRWRASGRERCRLHSTNRIYPGREGAELLFACVVHIPVQTMTSTLGPVLFNPLTYISSTITILQPLHITSSFYIISLHHYMKFYSGVPLQRFFKLCMNAVVWNFFIEQIRESWIQGNAPEVLDFESWAFLSLLDTVPVTIPQ